MKKVYLDYAATTPVAPEVMEAMLPYFSTSFGNPSSVHRPGQRAEAAAEDARSIVASYLNAAPSEITFTSCGTESNNLALRGAGMAMKHSRKAAHILTTPVEHHAVSKTAEDLAKYYGFELDYLPVDLYGMVDPKDVSNKIRRDTALVSVIYANNEIGSINPIQEIGKICRQAGVLFHTDAMQAGSFLSLDVDELQVDMLTIGAHKMYGPKGVGALYVRKGTPILPIQTGGSQERTLRAGTLNVPYIVGMGKSIQIAQEKKEELTAHLLPLRDRIIKLLIDEIPGSQLTGHPIQRLPNHASFVFEGVDGNQLLMHLDNEGFACSSGSACKTGSPEPSDVLLAIGLPKNLALGSLRLSLGRHTQPDEIELFCSALPGVIEAIRKLR